MNKLHESDLGGIFGVGSTVHGYLPSDQVRQDLSRHLRQRIIEVALTSTRPQVLGSGHHDSDDR
jgi:hypothetical protein